jgi:hypothetical protein
MQLKEAMRLACEKYGYQVKNTVYEAPMGYDATYYRRKLRRINKP